MKKKRSNTFETNSSSVHTITFDGKAINDLEVQKDGYIHINVRSFGKNYAAYQCAEDKLLYAILTVCYTNNIWLSWDYDYLDDEEAENEAEALMNAENDWCDCIDELKETSEYQAIEKVVRRIMSTPERECKGIRLHVGDGYIDHQSQCYDSLDEFLEDNKIPSIEEFIFGKAVLRTDCD